MQADRFYYRRSSERLCHLFKIPTAGTRESQSQLLTTKFSVLLLLGLSPYEAALFSSLAVLALENVFGVF